MREKKWVFHWLCFIYGT